MPEAVVFCPEFPYPVRGGGPLRTASLLEYLKGRYEIDLVVFAHPDELDAVDVLPPGLVRAARTIRLPVHRRDLAARGMRNLRRAIRRVPPLIDRFSGFDREIAEFMRGRRYELAVVEHFWLAPYRPLIRAGRVVLDVHNIESILLKRCGDVAPLGAKSLLHHFARACSALEHKWIPTFDLVLAASDTDARHIQHHEKVLVYPNSVPLVELPAVEKRHEIAFSGNLEYLPNQTAIQWFKDQIWPILRQRHPDLLWRVIGRNHERHLHWTSADPRITFTGPIEDAVTELASSQLAIAPLQSGSGTRLKIIEAWAAGLPVVSTSLGAEGLAPGAIIADSPEEFANAVTRLLNSGDERERIGRLGRQLYERRYSWPAAWRILETAGF